MSTMDRFLTHIDAHGDAACAELNRRVAEWVAGTNAALRAESLHIRLVQLGSIWGIRYNVPGRYHWMLQLFLRQEGVQLASVGTGSTILAPQPASRSRYAHAQRV
jgi:glutamate-1-semialdehyde 2,1-aminomutase